MHHRPIDTLAERLVRAREDAGLSTAQLARRLGVKTKTLANWERGVNEPRANRLLMLAGLLNVSPAWLIDGRLGGHPPETREQGIAELREQLDAARRLIVSLAAVVEDLDERLQRLPGGHPSFADEEETAA